MLEKAKSVIRHKKERSHVEYVRYADDLVICCRPGNGPAAMAAFRGIILRLGLTVNERKTRLVQLPEESFDFLGYTVGRFYGKAGRTFIGTSISKKAVIELKRRIHEETSSRWNWQRPEERVEVLNPILRGWCGYFNQGPVTRVYRAVRRYTENRLRSWLMRRIQRSGRGHHRFPDRYLYEELGLHPFADPRGAKANAKACRFG